MTRVRRCAPSAWLVAGALSLLPAAAAQLEHVVRPGESASAIAERYYGDYEPAGLLLRFNGIDGSLIRPGQTLRIPYCELHTVRAGDTWSAIAQRYLGRAGDYEAIAALNGLDPRAPLRSGTRIVVPVILSHRLQPGETLAGVGESLYGDASRAELLRSFNRIDDPRRLSVGREIRVPLVSLLLAEPAPGPPEPKREREKTDLAAPVAPAPAPAEAAAPVGPAPSKRLAGKLGRARRAFRDGDFAGALEALEALTDAMGREADPDLRGEFGTLLASVQVAFDRPREACRAYRAWVDPGTKTEPDPDLVSPKIRAALAQCRGAGPAGTGE